MILYYFPGKNTEDITAEYLQGVKLSHLVGLDLAFGIVSNNGPDGGRGCIKAISPKDGMVYEMVSRVGCWMSEQEWVKYGNIYIGWFKNNKPNPNGLVKREARGYYCKTNIGKFIVSPVRYMPNYVRLNSDGEVEYTPAEECQPAIKLIESVLNDFDTEDIKPDYIRLCAIALGMNYYIGEPECYALNMFERSSIYQIIQAVSDMPAIIEMMKATEDKKKAVADDTASISSGD